MYELHTKGKVITALIIFGIVAFVWNEKLLAVIIGLMGYVIMYFWDLLGRSEQDVAVLADEQSRMFVKYQLLYDSLCEDCKDRVHERAKSSTMYKCECEECECKEQ